MEQTHKISTAWVKTMINQKDCKYSPLGNTDPMGKQVTQQAYMERTKALLGRDGSGDSHYRCTPTQVNDVLLDFNGSGDTHYGTLLIPWGGR